MSFENGEKIIKYKIKKVWLINNNYKIVLIYLFYYNLW